MADDTPIYNFFQASPNGKPGFEAFKNKDENRYYFHYNDKEGEPVLFSQGYPSAKTRTAVLNALKHHISVPRSYSEIKEGHDYFFIIRATNNVEIARSKSFASSEERDQALETIQQEQKKPELTEKETDKPLAAAEKKQKEVEETNKSASRLKFNLTFRRVEKGKPFQGVIEYPISKKKVPFKGLDLDKIGAFIAKYLPEDQETILPDSNHNQALNKELADLTEQNTELQKAIHAAQKREEQLNQELSSKQKKETQLNQNLIQAKKEKESLNEELAFAQELELELKEEINNLKDQLEAQKKKKTPEPVTPKQIVNTKVATPKKEPVAVGPAKEKVDPQKTGNESVFFELKVRVDKQPIQKGSLFEIRMQMEPTEKSGYLSLFEATIIAKSLAGGRKIHVGNFKGKVLDNREVRIPINSSILSSGLYRFTMSGSLKSTVKSVADAPFTGTTIVQVF